MENVTVAPAATAQQSEAPFRAYCFADGVIHFGHQTPAGSMELLRGEERLVRERLEVAARHAYKTGVLLVPGVPEAKNQESARLAMREWINWFAKCDGLHQRFDGHLDWNRQLEQRS